MIKLIDWYTIDEQTKEKINEIIIEVNKQREDINKILVEMPIEDED